MAYRRPTIGDVAEEMADSLRRHDEAEARRLAFHFVESFDGATPDERAHMVAQVPESTGDARFDAFLAAVAEFVSARHQLAPPSWVDAPDRFLDTWWFVSGMRSLHADAIAHSPISFARRGVFITQDALSYA